MLWKEPLIFSVLVLSMASGVLFGVVAGMSSSSALTFRWVSES